jgi:polar amino acid transport system substrate-binding protein
MKYRFITTTLSFISFLIASPQTSAETVLETIQKTGVVKVAIREDAPPFGYLDSNGNLQGYCLDFFALFRKKLTQVLEREVLAIRLLKSNPDNRFELVDRGLVNLECGPNTIRNNIPDGVTFSTDFLTTGTQFLIKGNSAKEINLESNLQNVRIGLIRRTTTEEFITNRYPLAKIQKFQGVTARMRGVQALEQGKIDAFVSDGILLRGEAAIQNLSLEEYSLIPQPPITRDRYGMIIPSGDRSWHNLVNQIINSKESQELLNQWFGTNRE